MYDMARFISSLQEIQQDVGHEELKTLSKDNFVKFLRQDEDMEEFLSDTSLVEKLFSEKLKRNLKTINGFSGDILGKLENPKFLEFGFVSKKDKTHLDSYQKVLIEKIECDSRLARNNNENACNYLSKPFDVEEIVGELVYDEYSKGENYYLEIGGRILCVKNYKILQRDDFTINVWQDNNPLTRWTCIKAVELHFDKSKGFELHLLVLNGDENENTENLYFTLLAKDVVLI